MNTILRLVVFDRPGVLDRIAGLIRRNGCNISSINAGKVKNGMSQINIVLEDERMDVNKLGRQLYDINIISDYKVFSDENSYMRELALFRIKKSDYDQAALCGARIIAQDEIELSLEITGAPWEIEHMLSPIQDKLLDFARSGALPILKEGVDMR